jgi:hypothetical protein
MSAWAAIRIGHLLQMTILHGDSMRGARGFFSLILFAGSGLPSIAQESQQKNKPFSLWISIAANNQVTIEKEEPKAGFIKLSYSNKLSQQWIDQMGMVRDDKASLEAAVEFLFSIRIDGERVLLNCKKGCNWHELDYKPKSARQHLTERGADQR